MSVQHDTTDNGETMSVGDPGVVALEASLITAVRGDILAASRAQGVVPTQTMQMQAEMLARVATQCLLRRLQVLKVRITEKLETIEAFERDALATAGSVEGEAPTYEGEVAALKFMEQMGIGVVQKGLVRLDTIEGDGARSYIGTLFCLPIDAEAPPAPPPPPPKASSIIMPGH